MSKVSFLSILLLLTVVIVAPSGCIDSKDAVSATGTVKYIDLEGGFYGIIGDDGQRYDPINLSQQFQKDGLRVRFEAKPREDLDSIHMWGRLIEIINIEKLA